MAESKKKVNRIFVFLYVAVVTLTVSLCVWDWWESRKLIRVTEPRQISVTNDLGGEYKDDQYYCQLRDFCLFDIGVEVKSMIEHDAIVFLQPCDSSGDAPLVVVKMEYDEYFRVIPEEDSLKRQEPEIIGKLTKGLEEDFGLKVEEVEKEFGKNRKLYSMEMGYTPRDEAKDYHFRFWFIIVAAIGSLVLLTLIRYFVMKENSSKKKEEEFLRNLLRRDEE